MSHIRDLLHKPLGHKHGTTAFPSPLTVVDNNYAAAGQARTPTLLAAAPGIETAEPPAHPEFRIEEAYLGPENRLVFYTAPRSPAADRFRLLRMHLKEHWHAGKLKKLLVTSPLAHDGKSTVIMNLATALAERGKRTVLVVEADFHHSSIAQRLRLKQWAGLSECLVDEQMQPLSAVRQVEPLGWYLLPPGEPRRNPTELLQTPAFGHVMQKLAPHFDWILIDSPPVVPLTDALSLQQHVDATLLVARAGHTPREAVEHTIALLGKKNIVGIALNGVEDRDQICRQYYEDHVRHQDD